MLPRVTGGRGADFIGGSLAFGCAPFDRRTQRNPYPTNECGPAYHHPEAETYVRKIGISCECQHEAPNAPADKKSDDEPRNWDRHSKHICKDL